MSTEPSRSVDTLYTVKPGDSLSKIATQWYGDLGEVNRIAARNSISPQHILYIGQRLVLPATVASGETPSAGPASPGGSVPVDYDGAVIETVTTTATRLVPWYKDWRYLAAIGVGVGLVWFVASRKRR